MTEIKMEHPYKAHGKQLVKSVLGGGRHELRATESTLSGRLQEYAFYLMENAMDAGDALLVNDIHDAVAIIRRSEKATP